MINEKITNYYKEQQINRLIKNYKPSEEFTSDDYSRLKLLTQITKLEELKVIDKLSDYKGNATNTDDIPNYKFLRRDSKCLDNDYIPKTNYGYKHRNKQFSTALKKQINLNLFTQNKEKKIKLEDYFPNDFDEINEQIELKEMKNISDINRYLYEKESNIMKNLEEISNISKKKAKRAQSVTAKDKKSFYEKSFTEPNLNYDKNKHKRKTEIRRPIQSSKGNTNIDNAKIQNILNLKLLNKKIYQRNSTNFNISNNTTSLNSFSTSKTKKKKYLNTFKNIEKKVLNPDSFFITNNNNNFINSSSRANSSFKNSKQLINRIINDGNIIDKYITSNRLQMKKTQRKIDKEYILLKLKEKLDLQKSEKTKKAEKKIDLTDEHIFSNKLSLVPNFAKKFFREIYNRILFENRVLNKNEDYNIKSEMEKLLRRKKLKEQIKKETIKRMRIAKDNFITEKDDKILIDEEKKEFDLYGNLDGLEWLMMKRNIITYGKKYH